MKDVSVLIATYNRAKILRETLADFIKLNAQGIDWELIVIDNNSSDGTKQIAIEFNEKLPINYLFEKRQGKNYALNSGLEKARGNIIVFTDDDITPERNWLHRIVEASERWPNVNVFGGRVEPLFPCGVSQRIKNANFSSYVFGRYSPYPAEQVCINTSPVGGNCWFRDKIFERGFKYNPDIGPNGKRRVSGSELEFFVRLSNAGEKIVYVPSAVVYHRIQKYQVTFPYLLKRAYGGGRGWVRIYDPWRDSRKLGGIPVFLFKKVIEEFLTSLVYLAKGKNHLEPLMQLCQCVGAIAEYRASHLERKRSP